MEAGCPPEEEDYTHALCSVVSHTSVSSRRPPWPDDHLFVDALQAPQAAVGACGVLKGQPQAHTAWGVGVEEGAVLVGDLQGHDKHSRHASIKSRCDESDLLACALQPLKSCSEAHSQVAGMCHKIVHNAMRDA